MISLLIYNLLFFLVVLFSSPLWIIMVLKEKKWQDIFFSRAWLRTPENSSGFRGGIWVHSLSVGETLSAEPLVRRIAAKTERPVIISVSTLTGYETALRLYSDLDVLVVYFPFDFIWSVKKALDELDPACVIIIENDVWPNFIWLAKKRGTHMVWANARMSDRSFPRFFAFRKLVASIFSSFDLMFCQTSEDKNRLLKIGAGKEKILRSGNLKFDRDYTSGIQDGLTRLKTLNCADNNQIFVSGSTHQGEEEILLCVYESLSRKFPDVVFVIAPRNPERAGEISGLFERKGHAVTLFSQIGDGKSSGIIIVDCLGRLLELYFLADAAFIGGSLLSYGGHNPLEPAAFAKPVFFGPHMNDFREIADNMISDGGAVTVFSPDDLSEKLMEIFSDKQFALEMGRRANETYMRERGVSEFCLTELAARFPELFG